MRARRLVACALGLIGVCAVTPLAAQLPLGVAASAGTMEYRVRTTEGVEIYHGTLTGFRVALPLPLHAGILLSGRGGDLSSTDPAFSTRTMGELEARAVVQALPWLSVHAAGGVRGFSTPLGRQRWVMARAGVEAHVAFASGAWNAVARAELIPVVTVSGLPSPSQAYAASAGITWDSRWITAGLRYEIERHDGPSGSTEVREDQWAGLTAWAGIRLAGPPR